MSTTPIQGVQEGARWMVARPDANMAVGGAGLPGTRGVRDVRRRRIWLLLLFIGFWMARPYYIPWTIEEERNADTRATAAQGSIEREIAMPALGLLAVSMLFRSPRERRARRFGGRLSLVAAAYIAVCAVSLQWSVNPATTLKRLTVFLLCLLVLAAMARVYDAMELAEMGFILCGSVAVIAICSEIFLAHSFAPFDPEYRFLGVMSSNSEGQNLTCCIFCGLTLMLKHPRRTGWIVAALSAAGMLLFLTRSRTSAIACILLSLFFVKRKVEARHKPQTLMIVTLLLCALIFPLLIAHGGFLEVVQSGFMMGRQDTQNTASLSNRAPLWAELSGFVARRPVLGYGYNTFWTSETITTISAHQGWGVPNAHNTYLDQELSAGIAAMVLFAILLWGGLIRAWLRFRRNRCPETLLPAVMLSWLVMTSLVESVPLDPFLPTFLVYVFLAQTLMPEGAAFPVAEELADQSSTTRANSRAGSLPALK